MNESGKPMSDAECLYRTASELMAARKRIAELEAERASVLRDLEAGLSYVKGNSFMAQTLRGILKPIARKMKENKCT